MDILFYIIVVIGYIVINSYRDMKRHREHLDDDMRDKQHRHNVVYYNEQE